MVDDETSAVGVVVELAEPLPITLN